MTEHKPHPIAVVGVSTLFPGSVDATGFWRDILRGTDLITDVPASHWLIEDYYDPDPSAPDKTYANRGAFISPIDFDPMAWGVLPNAVPTTDTCQLLALIVAQRVLEDAARGQFDYEDRERMSVILGVTSAQELLGAMVARLQRPVWTKALREVGLGEDDVQEACKRIEDHYTPWQESTFPGALGNVVAGRIANRLNLGGTNCVTDAACASTFSALTMAVNELSLGQSDVVLCGGADTMNDIFMYLCFSKTPALSKTGDCRPFSDKADGTMLGEGFGMVALKRLEDAERDGDRVYAVIRAVGSSSDGKGTAVYAPVPRGQARAIRRAYDKLEYGPDSVELVEAHGTGTIAGDAAEFEGLRTVFEESGRKDRQWCAIGSVKSQIGHTKAAAGAAGLVKSIFALHHGVLPPTIKVDAPNPKLEIETSAFYLNTRSRPWIRSNSHPRRAGVSSFGFGGSNFHVALEEYTGDADRGLRRRTHESELFVLTAESPELLVEQCREMIAAASDEAMFGFLAGDSQASYRPTAKARLAIVADDAASLRSKLQKAVDAIPNGQAFDTPNGVSYGVGDPNGSVGFLFPGQGSQYVDMGADVAMTFETARAVWDAAASLDVFATEPIQDVVFPQSVFDEASKKAQAERLTSTDWAQPAIGVTSLSLLALLREIGLRPDAVGGHSFGEIVALHAAGVLSFDDTVRVARRRGELMKAAAATPGAMTAVTASVDAVRPLVGERVVIANHNSPTQVVLSGPTDAITEVETRLDEAGLRFIRLPVATAFHSSVVSGSVAPFAEFLEDVAVSTPTIDVYGNMSAAPYPKDRKAIRAIIAEQIANPVRFVDEIEAMYAAGVRTFVEVGPGAVLTNLVGAILAKRSHRAVALDRSGKHGVTSLSRGLAQLVAAGAPIDLSQLWRSFERIEDPRTATKPKLALKISGANYGKPYPPVNGAAGVPKPNAQPAERLTKNALGAPVAKSPVDEGEPGPIVQAAPVAQAAPVVPAAAPAAPVPAAPVLVVPTQGQAWASAYLEVQRHAIDAHAAYTRSMADAHAAFLRSQENALAILPQMMGGQVAAPSAAIVPTPIVHTPAPIAPARIVAPAPVVSAPVVSAPVVSALVASAPVVSAPVAVAVSPPRPPAPGPSANLQALMLDVVADKTGYPVDMLELSMDLEADLGVDSIKRVEILAAMRERADDLPEVDPSELGKLRTLQEIVDRMGGAMAATSVSAPVVSAPSSGFALQSLMLEVVAEKTGYPVDMLELSMDLEADLGVDSIKRVEILAAMRERAPNLPEVDPSELGKLRTLREIVDHMAAASPPSLSPPSLSPPSPHPSATIREMSAVVQAEGPDLQPLMLEVVAEKTGYPVNMLELSMDLEADLGVDSIKRVEILAAMRERAPNLPEIDPSELGKLRTLQEIVDRMGGAMGGSNDAPVAAPDTSGAPDSASLQAFMLEVVAEKTGYPSNMLELSMDLEADLGVDSIKRVEILAAMRERAPSLPEVDPSELGKLRTLQEIVDRMSRANNGAGAHTAEGVAPRASSRGSSSRGSKAAMRYALSLAPVAPTRFALEGLLTASDVAVVDGGSGLAPLISEMLAQYGIQASAKSPNASCDGVIFLGGLAEVVTIDDALAVQRAAFVAAKRISARVAEHGGVFVTVQDTGGDFGLSGSGRAWLGGLPGLVKTAAQEWPKAGVRAIDVDRAGRAPERIAGAIVHELLFGGRPVVDGASGGGAEVALSAEGERFTLVSSPRSVELGAARVTDSSVILASGGARGVTATTLIALAKATQCKLVLLGRTPLVDEPPGCAGASDDAALKRALLEASKARRERVSPKELGALAKQILSTREVRGTLAAIEAAGGTARYVAADVLDGDAIATALRAVRAEWGPITGIVHGAGLLADRLIVDKTEEQFDRVFDTKVRGLLTLLDATHGDPLELLLTFSSVAGRCGNPGQCDYAMANETLNKVVALEGQRREGFFGRSMGWGPWEGGMVTPALKQHFEQLGVPLIPLDVGAQMLVDELRDTSGDRELVLGGEPRAEALTTGTSTTGTSTKGTSTKGTKRRFEMCLNRTSFPSIDSHRVKGQPVLPAALVLELFGRAMRAARPDLSVASIDQLRVLRGVVLDRYETGGERLTVVLRQLSNGDGITFALELRDVDNKPRYRATGRSEASVRTLDAGGAVLHEDGPRDLSRFEGTLYDGVSLFHGDAFRVIQEAPHVGVEGVTARLSGGRDMGWNDVGWLGDPALIDGGLQLAVLWTCHQEGGAALPTSVESFRFNASGLIRGPVRAVLLGHELRADRSLSDIVFIDADGNAIAELRGVEMHVLPGSRDASASARPNS